MAVPRTEGMSMANAEWRASREDYEVCRRLHARHGSTYYLSSRLFPPRRRRQVDAVYGFVRVPDEIVDNAAGATKEECARKLDAYRRELLAGLEGQRPLHPVLRAFCETARQIAIPPEEPQIFLDAMERDLVQCTYATYDDLRGYMRGSAVAVALMMFPILGIPMREGFREGAASLAEAMQMTNFLRDVGEDLDRGRVYLPLEDLERFGLTLDDLRARRLDERFVGLMRFEIARTRELYAASDPHIARLPSFGRKPVRLARELYSRILNRIEDRGYDVFGGRARTGRLERAWTALRVAVAG
ncbi:MAG: phytoene/squalene synthase family protein [Fimbriimonadales bacterium]|nr:phytoene/squalene synthase family protein [Fimbriimonadales bacterium]